jgi:lysophospholipase L1-like esterase
MTAQIITPPFKKISIFDAPTLIIFGDSRVANCNRVSAVNIGSTLISWHEWANALSQQSMKLLRNAGVGGDTTTAMLARVNSDVIVYRPKFCAVLGGQNDSLDTPSAVLSTYNNLVNIYQALNNADIYVIALSELPDSTGSTAHKKGKQALNAKLAAYWRFRRGGEYVDIYRAIVDPLQTNSNPISSPQTTADGIHPNLYGALKIGQVLAPVYQRLAATRSYPLLSALQDRLDDNSMSLNACRNGLFQGTSGTITTGFSGSIANNWNTFRVGGGTGVMSLNARSDGFGNNQRLVAAATAAADSAGFQINSLGAFASFAAGQIWFADAEVTITNPINLAALELSLGFAGGGGPNTQAFTYVAGYGNGVYSENIGPVVYRTPDLLLPAGTYTGAAINITAYFTAPGSAQIDVGRVGVWGPL